MTVLATLLIVMAVLLTILAVDAAYIAAVHRGMQDVSSIMALAGARNCSIRTSCSTRLARRRPTRRRPGTRPPQWPTIIVAATTVSFPHCNASTQATLLCRRALSTT